MADPIPEDLKSRMKASYDAIAPTYNKQFTRPDDPVRLDYLTRLRTLLQSRNLGTANVLELGCGAGIPATKFFLDIEDPVCHVTGNDMSTTQLDLARENLSAYSDRVKLVQGDMLSLSFPANSLDAVAGFYSIIHLPRAEQTALMAKIVGWLKPGGFFLGNFTEEEQDALENKTWLGEEKGWMFWSGWGAEGSVGMVERSGLEVLVKEGRQSDNDARFVWVVGRKGEGKGNGGET